MSWGEDIVLNVVVLFGYSQIIIPVFVLCHIFFPVDVEVLQVGTKWQKARTLPPSPPLSPTLCPLSELRRVELYSLSLVRLQEPTLSPCLNVDRVSSHFFDTATGMPGDRRLLISEVHQPGSSFYRWLFGVAGSAGPVCLSPGSSSGNSEWQ